MVNDLQTIIIGIKEKKYYDIYFPLWIGMLILLVNSQIGHIQRLKILSPIVNKETAIPAKGGDSKEKDGILLGQECNHQIVRDFWYPKTEKRTITYFTGLMDDGSQAICLVVGSRASFTKAKDGKPCGKRDTQR